MTTSKSLVSSVFLALVCLGHRLYGVFLAVFVAFAVILQLMGGWD